MDDDFNSMASVGPTAKLLRNLRLNCREAHLPVDSSIEEEYETEPEEYVEASGLTPGLWTEDQGDLEIQETDLSKEDRTSIPSPPESPQILVGAKKPKFRDAHPLKFVDFSNSKAAKEESKRQELKKLRIKFGENLHPMLKYWMFILGLTGAPVYFNSEDVNNGILRSLRTLPSVSLLILYHLMFLKSVERVINSLDSHKDKYDSVWYQFYPIVFNLAVIIVVDMMWFFGLFNDTWLSCVLASFKEKPRGAAKLKMIRYNFVNGKHVELEESEDNFISLEISDKSNKTKEKVKVGSKFAYKRKPKTKLAKSLLSIGAFILRQLIPVGCCFTYLLTIYILMKPLHLNWHFFVDVINVIITCSAWLTIIWIYMSFCRLLKWRFEHLNEYLWQFRCKRVLPTEWQFRLISSTYFHYLDTVSIIDNFFKYWIGAIFGVLFFQVSLYFQFIVTMFENLKFDFRLLVIPLITVPFLAAILVLIKKAADVNEESKGPEEILAKTFLHVKGQINENFYKKIKFFLFLIREGSSLTLFGLVNITREFIGSAIVVMFSYTLILNEITPRNDHTCFCNCSLFNCI